MLTAGARLYRGAYLMRGAGDTIVPCAMNHEPIGIAAEDVLPGEPVTIDGGRWFPPMVRLAKAGLPAGMPLPPEAMAWVRGQSARR